MIAEKPRILGLDYGSKRIGCAMSDAFGWSAYPLETITRINPLDYKDSIRRIAEIIAKHKINTIVLGYPKKLDNTQGERCAQTLEFKRLLARAIPDIEIFMQDERFSSKSAEKIVQDLGFGRKKRREIYKNHIDKTAAVLILQCYLDKIAKESESDKINRNEDEKMVNENFEDVNEGMDDLDLDEEIELDCVVMTDEDGDEIEYAIIDEIAHNGNTYCVMIPTESIEDDEGDAAIFKVISSNDEEVIYEEIDEQEYEGLIEILKERLSDYEIEF
ncbi:MAG: Holliday junction resolvase RuvX [Defluviitaleaceae bacterium]|nr:Holliday junction resolvase RuvX [Defluviitaleaceae bacterium]